MQYSRWCLWIGLRRTLRAHTIFRYDSRLKLASCSGPVAGETLNPRPSWSDAINDYNNSSQTLTMASPGSLGFSWRRGHSSSASRDNDNTSPVHGAQSPQFTRAHPQNITAVPATPSSPSLHREPIRSFVSGGGRDTSGTCGVSLGTLMASRSSFHITMPVWNKVAHEPALK